MIPKSLLADPIKPEDIGAALGKAATPANAGEKIRMMEHLADSLWELLSTDRQREIMLEIQIRLHWLVLGPTPSDLMAEVLADQARACQKRFRRAKEVRP